jgi:hypothetical protein
MAFAHSLVGATEYLYMHLYDVAADVDSDELTTSMTIGSVAIHGSLAGVAGYCSNLQSLYDPPGFIGAPIFDGNLIFGLLPGLGPRLVYGDCFVLDDAGKRLW